MAVSEEKIQQCSRRCGQFSSSRFPCRKVPKPWQGQHLALPENRGIIFQQRRTLPENLSSSEFRTATAFLSFLRGGAYFAFFFGSDNSHTTQEGLSPEFRVTRLSRRKKKGPLWRFSACFPVFQAEKGHKKICTKPWLPVIRA